MLIPVKQAFLKYDLYKVVIPRDNENQSFSPDEIEKAVKETALSVRPVKIASKGMKFVYCNTDRKDARMGWYADEGSGLFREGNKGFGKMSSDWALAHLTEPEPYVNDSDKE